MESKPEGLRKGKMGGERVTPQVRNLIASVVYGGNMTRQTMNDIQAILDGDKTDKDEYFRDQIRSRLERAKSDASKQIAGLATVEEIPEFNPARFLLTPADHQAAKNVIDALRVSAKLEHWAFGMLRPSCCTALPDAERQRLPDTSHTRPGFRSCCSI